MQQYIRRTAESEFSILRDLMRIVFISGPRQCGKTTLLRHMTGDNTVFVSLDNADEFNFASEDPAGFLHAALHRSATVAIDEFQKVPALIGNIKYIVDRDDRPGQFLLSGSSDFQALPSTNESLAGRIGEVRLRTFTCAELAGKAPRFFERAAAGDFGDDLSIEECNKLLIISRAVEGGYPAVQGKSAALRKRWFALYLKALFDRDMLRATGLTRSSMIRPVAEHIAAVSGRSLNISDMSRATQQTRPAVTDCIQALKAMYLIDAVPAWTKRTFDRLSKSSKYYFTDTGLMCNLLSHNDPATLFKWSLAAGKAGSDTIGNLIETFIYTQLVSEVEADGNWTLYHLRNSQRQEIDFLLENEAGDLIAIEVKASASFSPDDFRHIRWLKESLPERKITGIVLYCGHKVICPADNLWAVPIAKFWH